MFMQNANLIMRSGQFLLKSRDKEHDDIQLFEISWKIAARIILQ